MSALAVRKCLPFAALVCFLSAPGVPAQTLAQTAGDDSRVWPDHFSHELAETLIADGRRQMAAHQYSEAEASYQRAQQITRINLGLRSPQQMRAIEHLLDALLAQGKWDAFDQQLAYLDWLNRSASGQDPDQQVAGLVLMSNWYRAAAAALDDSRSSWYLIHAKQLNWQAISKLERHFGTQDQRLAPLLYRVAMDHYYQAVSVQRRGMTSFEYMTDEKIPVNGWALSRNETVNASYRIGRENLLRIRSLYSRGPHATSLADAMILMHLADWELVFDHGEAATAYYQQAQQRLVEAGIHADDIERFFNRPAVLPETHLRVSWPLWESAWEQQTLEYVAWSPSYPGAQQPDDPLDTYKSRMESLRAQRATVYLNPERDSREMLDQDYDPGRFNYIVSDLEVVANPEIRDNVLDWVYAELPLLKLRPRIQNGRLTVHEAFTLDYVFSDGR